MYTNGFDGVGEGVARSSLSAANSLSTPVKADPLPTIEGIARHLSASSSSSTLNMLASPSCGISPQMGAENGDSSSNVVNSPTPQASTGFDDPKSGHKDSEVATWLDQPSTNEKVESLHQEAKSTQQVTFEDYISFSELSFEWADSYDTKDFDRLSRILAPQLNIDYTIVAPGLPKDERMSAQDFLTFVSNPLFLGDHLIRTQHLLGASKYVKLDDQNARGYIQIRAAHQREDEAHKAEFNGHGHALLHLHYRKIDGVWFLAGVKPVVYWNEGIFERIFQGPPV